MAEKQLEILRGYELRLLRCTLAPPPSDLRIQSQPLNEESQCSLLPLHEHINSLIDSNESGHYLQALYSDAAKLVLHTLDFVDINDSAECADRVYSELLQLVEAFIVNDSENDVDKACRVILLMCLSIAALFWFTQCNVTGLFSDSGWDMAPYIEAIDSQQSSCFILKFFCDLLRIRWESTHSRTKGRALEMMDKLVEGISNSSPGVTQRIPFCYVIYVPTIPALRKEYAKLFVSCGLIGEAIKIFEVLDLWDNLIYCNWYDVIDNRYPNLSLSLSFVLLMGVGFVCDVKNSLLGKKAAAVELIKARLSEKPNDPTLCQNDELNCGLLTCDTFCRCSLGGVTNNDACYEKALEVSNDKSLARSAYNRGEYETSKILREAAMALNSLYPDGWFALGAAALKIQARDVEKALDVFTRAVQLDPENGEAWNIIACLRNGWQLWENYSHVALDVGNIGQALEAVQMVLNITNNKRIDTELLERIVLNLEGRTSVIESDSCRTTHNVNSTNNTCAKDLHVESVHVSSLEGSIMGRSQENEHLMEFLWKILQQAAHVVRSESSADLWGLYARWLKSKGDLTMCSEALLKQVRSYQGTDLWKERDRFKRFSYASLELRKVYMEISSSFGSRRELFAGEMHLKNVLKQV
ncbi:TPR REGION domain-containing protein [Citrus sinensis]|nr:TPR REGION domain-containing protein [Citrus sinensis]